MDTKISNRLDYVDITKSIGMFTIIWGHIMLTGWSNLLVYSFHIPLFFFLSGMMFNGSKYASLGLFLKKRVKTLLIPYLIFSVLTWVLWVGLNCIQHNDVDIWMPLLETFIAQGSGGFLVHNVPLWFVTCLFVVEFLYYFINKLPEWANLLCCVVCAIIGYFMVSGDNLEFYRLLPWNIENAMSALVFYALGNIIMKHISHQELQQLVARRRIIVLSGIAVLTAVLVYSSGVNGHISVGSNKLGENAIVFYINAFIGIVTTLCFCIILSLLNPSTKVGKAISAYIKWFGKNSFYVMATHVPVKGILVMAVASIAHVPTMTVCSNIPLSLIVFIPTIAIDSIIVYVVCWIKKKDEQFVLARKGNTKVK